MKSLFQFFSTLKEKNQKSKDLKKKGSKRTKCYNQLPRKAKKNIKKKIGKRKKARF